MTQIRPVRIAAALSALLVAAVVHAQPPAAMLKQLEAKFTAADVDHDGKLTKDEAKAGMPRLYAHFDEIDTEHTGAITLDQIKAYLAAHKP